MQCSFCSEQNHASHRFCKGCGVPLVRTCYACGKTRSIGSRFCGGCGVNFSVLPPTHAAEGELKLVTVLFSDLVQSTELVAGLDAEAAMEALKPMLKIMCDAVEHCGGTVASVLGDGIMALFGAPLAQEGHATRASHAALKIRDAAGFRKRGMSVRSGLHSGEVVVDKQSDFTERDLKAYGLTLHLASRLPAQVEPQEICLTDATRALLPEDYELRPLGLRTLRGVPELVPLHLLLGFKAATYGRNLDSIAAPLVGRDREMALLQRTLEADEAPSINITAIIGPPGTGKSRLCREFAALCRADGIPVSEIRAQPYGTATPLQPMIEFLRSTWLRLGPNDPPHLCANRIEQALAEIGATDPPDTALVCDFLGIRARQLLPSWPNQKARVARLIDIVRAVVSQRGAIRSVIILEDLHWLDEASETFVAALAEAVLSTRCLLVVNSRPGHDRSWMQGPQVHRIELADLTQQDTEALIVSLVGPDPPLADLRHRIAARSGGNPFFAEELVHALQGQGIITGQHGAFRRSEMPGRGVLPATVQAVISARIDSLPVQMRRVLQTAAVIGQTFRVEILHAVTETQQAILEPSLDKLCDDGLLSRESDADAASYGFRHPLIQEVAYATQLRTRRLPLHAAIGRAMERLHQTRYEATASLIAYHYEEANEIRRAATFAAHAARWLGPRSSAEATRFWHKVRLLMRQEPRSSETDALRIEASGQIAWVGWREGLTSEQAQPFVQEALQWARETDASITPLLMQVEGRIAQVNGGSADTFVQRLQQAIQLAEDKKDAGRIATLQAALSHAYGWAGLLHQALEANDAALAGVTAVSDFDHRFLGYSVQHWAIALRGRILVRLGRFDEAMACLDAIIDINELIDPTVQFIGHLGYVDLAWCTGDAAVAKRHAVQIGALAERHGSAYLQVYHDVVSAVARGVAGDPDAAIRGILESLNRLTRTGTAIELEPELLAALAEYYILVGNPAAAMQPARDSIVLADRCNARLPGCRARICLARAMLKTRGADASSDSAALIAQAEQLIQETGATIYLRLWREARCDLDCCLTSVPYVGQ